MKWSIKPPAKRFLNLVLLLSQELSESSSGSKQIVFELRSLHVNSYLRLARIPPSLLDPHPQLSSTLPSPSRRSLMSSCLIVFHTSYLISQMLRCRM
jgi:hypothetical protein